MPELFDLLLPRPISIEFGRAALFFAFTFHMLFVLLTLGTAMLALFYFIHTWWGGRLDEVRWDKPILRTFLAHKSLAVVLGVAPLLLIEIVGSVPFLTSISIHAPYAIAIVPLLIVAFLCLDFLGQRIDTHHYLHLVLGSIGLICLLIVPGIFVALLVTYENPDRWSAIVRNGNRLEAWMAFYWLFRYLHVLGAAIVFGATFHYLVAPREDIDRRRSLLRWIVAGMLAQFLLGTMLYASLPEPPDRIALGCMLVGIGTAVVTLWIIFLRLGNGSDLKIRTVVPLLTLILVMMLLTRQRIQDRKLLPLERRLDANAVAYREQLEPFREPALAAYQARLKLDYSQPETIYQQSCAFCHGDDGRGGGPEAGRLAIPPENLAAIRTNRQQLRLILQHGVPGTGMPYFSFFDGHKQDRLIDYLDQRFNVLAAPKAMDVEITAATRDQAQSIFAETCAVCHGKDGRGTRLSRGFEPPPPDFTQYHLTPDRAFQVISQGYAGTMMPPFGELSEDVRWALVEIVNSFDEASQAVSHQ